MYSVLLMPKVWFGISILVFVICTGGIVYSMTNNMPLFKFERNEYGSVIVGEYFMRGGRGQYAGEGYIASVLFTVIGLSYLYLSKIHCNVNEKHQQRIQIVVCLLCIYILQKVLIGVYKLKSPWYNPTFSPPDYYTTGPLARDQGNNI